MASKLTLIDISSGFKGTDVNTNFTSIEDEFDDTLSRSGKSPNTMNAELDMNSNKIRNLAQAANNSDAATLKDVLDQTTEDATSKPATAITVSDSASHYSGSNVEAVLEEIGDGTTDVVTSGGGNFPNVSSNVTASHTELNKLDGVTASTSEINKLDGLTASTADLEATQGHASSLDTILDNYDKQTVTLGGDFDADQQIRLTRIGDFVCITTDGDLDHSSGSDIDSAAGDIPSNFRPSHEVWTSQSAGSDYIQQIFVFPDGTFTIKYRQRSSFSNTTTNRTSMVGTLGQDDGVSITYVL